MKLSLIALLAVVTSLSAFSAERACPEKVLTCKLERTTPTGSRVVLSRSEGRFDGVNHDEPSIEPAYCTIRTAAYGTKITFNVEVSEEESKTYIYLTDSEFRLLPGDVAFNAVDGQSFFYRYNDQLLTCVLK